MKYRKLTEDGDYMLGRRDQFYEGREAAAQAAKTRLLLLQGEWWENTEDGLPLYQEILNTFHAPDRRAELIDLIISERILGTTGVESLVAFDSDIDEQTRTYSAVCVVQSKYGTIGMQISGSGSGFLTIS